MKDSLQKANEESAAHSTDQLRALWPMRAVSKANQNILSLLRQ